MPVPHRHRRQEIGNLKGPLGTKLKDLANAPGHDLCRRKLDRLSIHKLSKLGSFGKNASTLAKMIAETATLRPRTREVGIVQQIFAYESPIGRQSGRLGLGFDSSCAITWRHLGMKLHRKLRQAVKDRGKRFNDGQW